MAWSDGHASWFHEDALRDGYEKAQIQYRQIRMPSLDDYDEGRSGPFLYGGSDDVKWFERFFPDNNE